MKIVLGNFKWYRIKKILFFFICMGCSLAAIICINNNELNTGFLFTGLILYEVITNLPFIKNYHYEAYISDQGNIIDIKTVKKEYFIRKMDITDVVLKEIWYGGKWLVVIGYRLIVKADKKYTFDSVFLNKEKTQKKAEMEQMMQFFKV